MFNVPNCFSNFSKIFIIQLKKLLSNIFLKIEGNKSIDLRKI
jgi:hypothetical protein